MSEPRLKARFRPTNSRASEDLPRPTLASALLLAVIVAYGVHVLLISGPAMREAAQEQLEQTIAAEDRDICGQFGIRPGTSQFNVCSRELANVRQKQTDRVNAAAQGIF
ncbi:hypothetical protein [Bradyrhizobium liaoningense]|uniref:hypothetical protein n=1 Tax=Bradyrhizobium liaoningense TaxID=43992 RepID=UPI001BA57B95|nr:hypothetical protein [Bradyrhizobium liaoningense]MBR0857657.1 hypothetical protein [Bradyrhizobium liaoningense]